MKSAIENKYSYFIIGIILIFSIFVVIIDGYLIHRTYQYFGGGALNRPYALNSWPQYIQYIGSSFLFDILFFSLFSLMFHFVIRNKTKLQSITYLLIFLIIPYGLSINLKYSIFKYFGLNFDISTLGELAAGNYLQILTYFNLTHLYLILVALILFTLLFFFIKRITQLGGETRERTNLISALPATCLLLIALVGSVIVVSPNRNLHHGLNSKISFFAIEFLADKLLDFDGDGFGPFTLPKDTDNSTASIYPFAVDIPENGIDENGWSGDLKLLGQKKRTLALLPKGIKKNVIVIVVETFRTDVLHKKINDIPIMPTLDAYSGKHAYTLDAFSNYGVTARAIQTVFAGTLHFGNRPITLFDRFRERGYRLLGASGQDEDWGNTRKILQFNRLDEFWDAKIHLSNHEKLTNYERWTNATPTVESRIVNQEAKKLIDSGDSPFFMYINYQDLHYPYHVKDSEKVFIKNAYTTSDFFTESNRRKIYLQYANTAHHLDKSFSDLFEFLKKKKIFNNTLIVIVGDHPDSFYENGVLGHAWTLDEHQRRTPLIIINGSGNYQTPIGQDEIADIIINSVSNGAQKEPLKFYPQQGKKIFLISGTLAEPRSLGLIDSQDLFYFDFYTLQFSSGQKTGSRYLNSLNKKSVDYGIFNSLIRQWELQRYFQSLSIIN